jgi:hypothetical protein
MKPGRNACSGLAVALICTLFGQPAGAADTDKLVDYHDHRLTVRVRDAPLAEVLGDIGRQCQAEIRGQVPARTITAEFQDLPLSEALPQLLRDENFAVIYGSDGRMAAIQLLEHSALGPAPASAPTPAGPFAKATTVPEAERQAAVMSRTVPVTGALATALGTRRPTAGQLAHATLNQENPEVRAAAQRAFLAALKSDPELEYAYLSVLQPIDDETLARILHGMSKDQAAEEFMTQLAAVARSKELRAKAAAVVQQLRGSAGTHGEWNPYGQQPDQAPAGDDGAP